MSSSAKSRLYHFDYTRDGFLDFSGCLSQFVSCVRCAKPEAVGRVDKSAEIQGVLRMMGVASHLSRRYCYSPINRT